MLRGNLRYVLVAVVLLAFFGWILANMGSQSHGRTLAYLLGAIALFLVVLGVSAKLFGAGEPDDAGAFDEEDGEAATG